jgi:hypothetical protein
VRSIPEACARIEGRFTGQSANPYSVTLVRTHPNCQPRALWIDAAKTTPSTAAGWILNDLVRVPRAGCPSQQAVVRVWRRPVPVATPALDGQGRARVYVEEAIRGVPTAVKRPAFTATVTTEGADCGTGR